MNTPDVQGAADQSHARPPLTFLHGFMGAPSDWDEVSCQLPDYQIVRPSIQPAANWEAGVRQLAAQLPPSSVLVGYSMGARFALALALACPHVCRGLVFVSGNPGLEIQSERQARYRADCEIARRIDTQPREEFLNYWYTESTVFRSLTPAVRAAEIQRKMQRPQDAWSEILRSFSVAKQPNYWPQLEQLTMPVLAIAGQHDRKYARFIGRLGELGNIETRIVPACGHIVHHEQPDVFLHLLKAFLQRIEPFGS